jgi:D-lactate dehydrogenase
LAPSLLFSGVGRAGGMKVAIFDAHRYDLESFDATNTRYNLELRYFEARLTQDTASLAAGFPAICSFVNDRLNTPTLRTLSQGGVRLIALRSAGYNQVDLAAASELGLPIVRVPDYFAETTLANVKAFEDGLPLRHEVLRDQITGKVRR